MNHKIVYPYETDTADDVLGFYDPFLSEIRLIDDRSESYPWSKICETLIHEILHGVDMVYCNNFFEDNVITILGMAWYQILHENNISVFSNKGFIPKKIKVGMHNYTVLYPHIFLDENDFVNTTTDNDMLTIKISSSSRGIEIGDQFLKLNVVTGITGAIKIVYLRAIEHDDDNEFNSKLICLSNGFYQVLSDNNLEEIVKNDY